VVEPSEHRATLDNSCWYEVLRQGGGAERGWASLVDSLVRSCAVEVRTVLSEDALQMALAEQKDVVQAFSAKRTHKSLDESVCRGRKDDADTGAVSDVVEGLGELAIVIAEQRLRPVAERGQVAQLLDGPGDGGRHRGCGMDELSRFEVDDDEDVVTAKPEIADLDEIAGPDRCSLLAKEGGPTLAIRRHGEDLAQVPPDGSLCDGDAQFEEFASDALSAPQTVLGRHAANEVDDLGRQARGTRWLSPGAPLPPQPEAISVPAQKRIGLDEHEGVAPVREHRREGHQEGAFRGAKLRLLAASGGNQEFVGEGRRSPR